MEYLQSVAVIILTLTILITNLSVCYKKLVINYFTNKNQFCAKTFSTIIHGQYT